MLKVASHLRQKQELSVDLKFSFFLAQHKQSVSRGGVEEEGHVDRRIPSLPRPGKYTSC